MAQQIGVLVLVALLSGAGISRADHAFGPPQDRAADRENLAALQRAVAKAPTDPGTAARLARTCMDQHRRTGNPAFLEQARRALEHWRGRPDIPPPVRLARADLLQRSHRFTEALAETDRLLELDRRNAQAWLIKSNLHGLRGEYDEARAACARLVPLAEPLVTVAASAALSALTGSAKQGYALLADTLKHPKTRPSPAERAWAMGILGELAETLGMDREAEAHYLAALQADPGDPFLVAALADLLLRAARPEEAERLVAPRAHRPGMKLRRVLARAMLDRDTADQRADVIALKSFYTGTGADGHHLDAARFFLHVLEDPATALIHALKNWKTQRTPRDTAMLLECARAAGRPEAAQPALDWLAAHPPDSMRLKTLAANLRAPRMPAQLEWKRDGLRILHPPGWEPVTESLHARLLAERDGRNDPLGTLKTGAGRISTMLAAKVGGKPDRVVEEVLRKSIAVAEPATSFPAPWSVQLWDRKTLNAFLDTGGELPGLTWQPERNRFEAVRRFESSRRAQASPAVPLYFDGTDTGTRIAEGRRQIESLLAFHERNRAVHAGMCLHEAAEAAVRRAGLPADPRWLAEGLANHLAAELLEEIGGPEPAGHFRASHDPARYTEWKTRTRLDGWTATSETPDENLLHARYAFSTFEARALAAALGKEGLPGLFAALRAGKMPVYEVIREKTDIDWRQRLRTYSKPKPNPQPPTPNPEP